MRDSGVKVTPVVGGGDWERDCVLWISRVMVVEGKEGLGRGRTCRRRRLC